MVDLRRVDGWMDGYVFDQLIYLHLGSFQLLVKICGYKRRRSSKNPVLHGVGVL